MSAPFLLLTLTNSDIRKGYKESGDSLYNSLRSFPMSVTILPLSPNSEARYAPVRCLGVPFYAVGFYCSGVMVAYSTHMSEQGCVQWAFRQSRNQLVT